MPTESTDLKNEKSNAIILIIVLLIFGLVLGGFGLYRYNLASESASWPSVQGKITYAHAESRKVKTGHQYLPAVKYSYRVDGKSYRGTRITASDPYQKTLTGAKDILKRYPVGGEVSVYYKPTDPGISLLEAGMLKNVYPLLGGAVACFLLAALITVSAVKKSRKR
jgi:hypothetical protein